MALYPSPDNQTSLSQLAFGFKRRSSNFDFQNGSHFGFPIRTIFAAVDLQVTSLLLMNFESIALLVQEKKVKIYFQHGCWGEHLRFLIRMSLTIFYLKSPRYFLSNFKSMDLSIQKKFKIDFQNGRCGSHLVIPIGTILAIFINKSPR